MITNLLMGACVVIGLILVAPTIMSMWKSKESDSVPTPTPDVAPATKPIVNVSVPTPKTNPVTQENLALIVSEWEKFVNLLQANNMRESAEDMKTLLMKMVQEYRADLNEDDEDEGVGSIDGIAVEGSQEKGV